MFRPNALIAMALAPELFNKEKAVIHLRKSEKLMISPNADSRSIGISLLDPFDKMYDALNAKVN